jgi:hypothetical protein
MRIYGALFAVVFFLVCACAPMTIKPDQLREINKVGVISLIGDKIHLKHVGTTIFTNSDTYQQVEGWEIDKFVVDLVKKRLATKSTLECVGLPDEIYGLDKMRKLKENTAYYDSDLEAAKNEFRTIANRHGIDTFIVVTKYQFDVTGSGLFVSGYSLYKRSFLLLKEAKILISAQLKVMDAKSIELLATRPLVSWQKVDSDYWKESIASLSGTELSYLESAIKNMLEEKVVSVIDKTGILN